MEPVIINLKQNFYPQNLGIASIVWGCTGENWVPKVFFLQPRFLFHFKLFKLTLNSKMTKMLGLPVLSWCLFVYFLMLCTDCLCCCVWWRRPCLELLVLVQSSRDASTTQSAAVSLQIRPAWIPGINLQVEAMTLWHWESWGKLCYICCSGQAQNWSFLY